MPVTNDSAKCGQLFGREPEITRHWEDQSWARSKVHLRKYLLNPALWNAQVFTPRQALPRLWHPIPGIDPVRVCQKTCCSRRALVKQDAQRVNAGCAQTAHETSTKRRMTISILPECVSHTNLLIERIIQWVNTGLRLSPGPLTRPPISVLAADQWSSC